MMPVLENARHEIFAKAVAGGKSASEAYRGAGYQCAPRKARGHGYRLRSRADISARIHELSAKAVAHVAEGLYNRARGMSVPAVKIFQGTPEGGPVIVPHQEHLPPDVGAAKLWLSRRQPDLWRERQQVDVTATVAHRIAQMSPEERAADAVELMARVRRRLAEYQQTIEHEPSPEPETDD